MEQSTKTKGKKCCNCCDGNNNSGGINNNFFNRPDVIDFIASYLSRNNLNEYGYRISPGITQRKPPAYAIGERNGTYVNTYHWVYTGSASIRDAVRQRFPKDFNY